MADKQEDKERKTAENLAYNVHLIKILGLLELERGIDFVRIRDDCELTNVQFLYDITKGAKKFTGSFKNMLVKKYPFINKQYIDEGERAGEPFIKNGIERNNFLNPQAMTEDTQFLKGMIVFLQKEFSKVTDTNLDQAEAIKNFSIELVKKKAS